MDRQVEADGRTTQTNRDGRRYVSVPFGEEEEEEDEEQGSSDILQG